MVALGREGFLAIAPPFTGDILWEHLEILQKGLSHIKLSIPTAIYFEWERERGAIVSVQDRRSYCDHADYYIQLFVNL